MHAEIHFFFKNLAIINTILHVVIEIKHHRTNEPMEAWNFILQTTGIDVKYYYIQCVLTKGYLISYCSNTETALPATGI